MHANKVVVHIVQSDRGNVIFEFLGERIGEPSETAHRHPHGKVLALHEAGRNVVRVGVTCN